MPSVSPAGGPKLVTRRASEIIPKAVEWLWPGRLPVGMLVELIGDPGHGKSTLTADIAARVSRGLGYPPDDDGARPPADVLFVSAEDSAEHIIRPRLQAAGADLDRVHILDHVAHGAAAGPLVLPDHLDLIRDRLTETGARLVVLDPLNSFISGRVDGHTDQAIRSALMYPLKALAEATGTTVLVVRHLNKGAGKAVYRGNGSIGFTGAVRVSLVVGPHPHDPGKRVLACVKSNVGPEPGALVYAMEPAGGVARIGWYEAVTLTADDILAPSPEARGERHQPRRVAAAEFLRELLLDGPRPAAECETLAKDKGFSDATVNRAKRSLGVESDKTGMAGGWVWRLPGAATSEGDQVEGDHPSPPTNEVIPFVKSATLPRRVPKGINPRPK